VGRLAARLAGIPAVFTAHGWAFTEGVASGRRAVFRIAEHLAAALCERIIVVSEYDRRLALREGVCAADKLVKIHNGVPDVPQRARPGEARPRTRVIMVARLDAPKRQAELLDALRATGPDGWELDLVGDGPGEDALRRSVAELRLTDRVRVLGLRADVPELLAGAQVGALVSGFEGFPLVTLEYMRAGLPVVASEVGGVAEAVRHGRNGLLVRPGDPLGLREALSSLLDAPQRRAELGARGRADYAAEFTLDRMVEETLALYHETILRRGEGRP
jgi:glycosyltransferase involved in cell wall biosynthesis